MWHRVTGDAGPPHGAAGKPCRHSRLPGFSQKGNGAGCLGEPHGPVFSSSPRPAQAPPRSQGEPGRVRCGFWGAARSQHGKRFRPGHGIHREQLARVWLPKVAVYPASRSSCSSSSASSQCRFKYSAWARTNKSSLAGLPSSPRRIGIKRQPWTAYPSQIAPRANQPAASSQVGNDALHTRLLTSPKFTAAANPNAPSRALPSPRHHNLGKPGQKQVIRDQATIWR